MIAMTSLSRRAPRLGATFLTASLTLLIGLAASLAARADEPPGLSAEVLGQSVRIEDGLQGATDAFRALGNAAGIEVAFDRNYKESRLILNGGESTLAEALEKLARASDSFWVATGPRSIFVAADTPQNRRENEPVVVRNYRLQHAQIEDVMTAVRSLAGAKHVFADETRGVLTVRDTQEKVQLVDHLVARHDLRPSETLVRLELVAVDPRTGGPSAGEAEGAGRQILNADASIVGDGRAAVRVERSPLDPSTWIDLMVQINAQARGEEILLALEIESAVVRAGSENTRAATQSTWSSRSDRPLLVHLPLSVELDGVPKTLALRVTPKVVDAGEAPPAEALWVGTETNISVPSDRAE